MTTDQASTEQAHEQERRAALQDNQAYWREEDSPSSDIIPDLCAQCVNWQPDRQLRLSDGTTKRSPGFCILRAAADLEQVPQDYASRCSFYEEGIPF